MRIRSAALAAIRAHAARDRPHECCGLLLGADDWIAEAWPARNLAASPVRFEVDPQDHFAAIRHGRRSGRRIVGAYHSHPEGPDHPSETDCAKLADASMLQIIATPAAADASVRIFRWIDGRFVPDRLIEEAGD